MSGFSQKVVSICICSWGCRKNYYSTHIFHNTDRLGERKTKASRIQVNTHIT